MASASPTQGTDEGESFGKYRLLKRIGIGGMAEVYLAERAGSAGFQKRLVIKRVLGHHQHDAHFVEMFLDEARLVARLSHPNIVQTFDLGQADGSYFIAMEYIAGQTVSSLTKRLATLGVTLPLNAAVRIVSQLLEALNYAHALPDDEGAPLNIVHRDVTPSNVMVTPQGGVKLLDFGIARAEQRQHITEAGVVKGKLGYMAPEQVSSQPLDRRTDIFAAGALLYRLATGKGPYAESSHSSIYQDMMKARFPRPTAAAPGLEPELERIILKAMSLKPDARYPTAFDMLQDLEVFAAQRALTVGPRALADVMQLAFPEFFQQPGVSDQPSSVPSLAPPIEMGTGDLLLSTKEERATPAHHVSSPTLPSVPTLSDRPRGPVPSTAQAPAPTQPTERGNTTPGPWWRPAALLGALVLATLALGGWLLWPRSAPSTLIPEPPVAVVVPPVALPVKEDQPAVLPPVAVPGKEDPKLPATDDLAALPALASAPPRPAILKRRPALPVNRTPLPAPAKGTVTITTIPAARVSVGGHDYGLTPQKVELPEGMQTLLVEYPNGIKRVLLVNVMPGKETPVTARMESQ